MKLTTTTRVSVDGVMQGNGAGKRDSNRADGQGRPAPGSGDKEAHGVHREIYQRADAFLFGRRTYGLFAGYWGVRTDLEDPIVWVANTRPKYVASTTLTDPQWADDRPLRGHRGGHRRAESQAGG